MEPTGLYTRSYAYMLWLFRMCLWWNSLEWEWGMGSLTFFHCSCYPFLFTVLSQSALIWMFVSCLNAFSYSVFCWYDWEDCSFLKGKVDAREREGRWPEKTGGRRSCVWSVLCERKINTIKIVINPFVPKYFKFF